MNIVIDLRAFEQFINLPPDTMFWVFFTNFAWPFLGLIFLLGVRDLYLFWLRGKWGANHKFIMLAIDIPRGNEQSPKAVENMFTYFAGAHGSINFFEKWFEGQYQKAFSFEIVSLEGYTQFIIRTPIEWRNLVETAVYSQYPDAEISEVEDYTNFVPHNVPDEEYDFWGVEFIQAAPSAYPIKLYKEFEHTFGPSEMQFKDPMASLMDLCGSLRQGENLWFQIIVVPTGFDWIKDSEKEANKILGRKAKVKESLAMKGVTALGEASEFFYPIWGDIDGSAKKEEKPKTMMDLSPAEKEKIEAIQMKASKVGFEAKMRVIYIAKKDVINRGKVVAGFVGYIKQFISLNLNNLRPDMTRTATKTAYFRKAPRLIVKKKKLLNAYINRSDSIGAGAGIFNIEELATLWHFPVEASVRAAMVQKAPGRKADAPASLPLENLQENQSESFINFISNQEEENKQQTEAIETTEALADLVEEAVEDKTADVSTTRPPDNLPFV